MRKKAFILASIYSIIVIAFKLFVWKGGHTFDPAYRWSHGISLLVIIPFIIYGVKWVKDDNGGYIGGKLAGQTGLSITLFAAMILFAYHYIEFNSSMELYKAYYNSDEFISSIENHPQAKKMGVDKVKAVEMMIANLSPFKAATMKLISLLVVAFPCAFLCAVFMKKHPTQ